MYLVDDIDGVLTDLRRDTHLVDEVADVLHGVIRCRIQLVNVKRPLLIEGLTRLAFVAGIKTVLRIQAVNGLGEDTRTSGLTYSTRTAEEVRMSQTVLTNRVLQGLRQGLLTYH